jgi:hypothetical protein
VADFIFSVSRTIEDKQNNQGKIFVAKNRNGPDGMVYNIFMDTSNVNIKILPSIPNQSAGTSGSAVVTAPVTLSAKQQQELLKNKYTKLRRLSTILRPSPYLDLQDRKNLVR